MKLKLRTILPLLESNSNEVTDTTEQFDEYQRILTLAQKACMQIILQKDITSVKLKGVFTESKCISLEISRLSIKFTLNLYLFQFASSVGNDTSQLVEINIKRDEDQEEVVSIIKEMIVSKIIILMVGSTSEELIRQILMEMKESHKILSFRKSFTGDDINGIDFFFSLRDYRDQYVEIPLQVKTSARGQKYHRVKFAHIPSIMVTEHDSREDIIVRIEKIGDAYTARQKSILHI